jgi:hypothetical protein
VGTAEIKMLDRYRQAFVSSANRFGFHGISQSAYL